MSAFPTLLVDEQCFRLNEQETTDRGRFLMVAASMFGKRLMDFPQVTDRGRRKHDREEQSKPQERRGPKRPES